MLSIDVLSTKPINSVNGQNIVDLTVSSISSSVQGNISFVNVAMCPYEFEMRPDLFSKVYLGDQNHMGLLLKLNSISNPFSIVMGDMFLIPSLDSLNTLLAQNQPDASGASDRTSFRKKLADRISKISPDRKNYLDARAISAAAAGSSTNNTGTGSNAPLPPNVAGASDQQFQVQDGKLIFGSSIGTCRTALTENKSQATIKARLAQRNIFGS